MNPVKLIINPIDNVFINIEVYLCNVLVVNYSFDKSRLDKEVIVHKELEITTENNIKY